MTNEIETKYVAFSLEDKGIADNGSFQGFASVYNNVDHGGDIVLPGAFKTSLAANPRPKMLWQHDPGKVIGVWEEMKDDPRGLIGRGRLLTELQLGKEAHILLKAGAVDGLSIGYRVVDVDFKKTDKGMMREIKAAELLEVSIVTFPMNPKALVTDVKQLQSLREVETILRAAGVPATFAKLVATHGFEEAKARLSKDQREAGGQDDQPRGGLSALLNEIRRLKETINAQG